MAETPRRRTWSNSLGNIESRLRRALGLAGPIGLTLEDPLPLVPVVIADDALRPGASQDAFRGRRWAAPFDVAITPGAPPGSCTVQSMHEGGIIVDTLQFSIDSAAAADIYGLRLTYIQAAAAAAIPYALAAGGMLVDPSFEVAGGTAFPPIRVGSSGLFGVVNPQIWEGFSGLGVSTLIPVDVYLPRNAALMFGNIPNAPQAINLRATFRGRIF